MKRKIKDITNKNGFTIYDSLKDIEITKDNLYSVILSIKEKDICSTLIYKIFGNFNGENLCNPYDILTIPPNIYHGNDQFVTTVGVWIFNMYFIAPDLFPLFGYIQEEVGSKMMGKINTKLSHAFIEDKITVEQLNKFLHKAVQFAAYEIILTPNHSEVMMSSTKLINKKKDEILKKYEKQLNSDDNTEVILYAEKAEKELLDYVEETIGDDPALDTFKSGAQGSIGNNFKNMFVMKGAVVDPISGKAKVLKSNYADGVSADEYATLANTLAAGPYSRSQKTATGGYWEKLFVSAFQHLILDPPGSDCGTKRTVTVTLTNDNINDWMYNYIVSGSNLIELTSDNADSYIGKTVKFRFSSLCESKTGFCNKCAGNLFYRINMPNVGVSTSQIPSKLKLICMKQFHDSTINTTTMNIAKAFGIE